VDARVGTSGFSYDFWKGGFYPADIKSDAMLEHYAARFDTVEINNTFYRMPRREMLERWAAVVPDGFTFVIKASQRITHRARLENAKDSVDYLFDKLVALGDKLGPVLFQCPPNLKRDLPRLRDFLAILPPGTRAVMELRNATWMCDETYAILREAGAVLCASDEPEHAAPIVQTADWGYVRLRAESYDEDALRGWVDRIAAAWPRAWVFFKHEETAPAQVERLTALFAAHDRDAGT
jgi:uncharacterized protein YecE (DUF72 family)